MRARHGGALLALSAALVLGGPGAGNAQAADEGGVVVPALEVSGPCEPLLGDDDCVAGATRLVGSFYDEICYVAPSATTSAAAAVPEVCGKNADDIADDATALAAFLTALVNDVVGSVCGIAPSAMASTAASEPSVCGKDLADLVADAQALAAYLTARVNEVYGTACALAPSMTTASSAGSEPQLCGRTVAEVTAQVQVLVAQAQALVFQLLGDLSGQIGGVPNASTARAAQAQAQLKIDEFDDLIPQLPTCDVAATTALTMPAIPPLIAQLFGTPWPVLPDGCIDESGMLEPPAIPGPKAALLAEKALGTGAYCQTGEENDPDDSGEGGTTKDGHVWTAVRGFGATAKSFAIGNCHDDWAMTIDHRLNEGMVGGYFSQEVGHCAFIAESHTIAMGASSSPACSSSSYPKFRQFAQYFNCSRKLDKEGKCNSRDGTKVDNDEVCQRYFNVRPWLNPTQPQSQAPLLNQTWAKHPNGQPRFKWRYVTKDGRYVLVKDTVRHSGTGRWLFVPRSCLVDPLPGPHVYPNDLYTTDNDG